MYQRVKHVDMLFPDPDSPAQQHPQWPNEADQRSKAGAKESDDIREGVAVDGHRGTKDQHKTWRKTRFTKKGGEKTWRNKNGTKPYKTWKTTNIENLLPSGNLT